MGMVAGEELSAPRIEVWDPQWWSQTTRVEAAGAATAAEPDRTDSCTPLFEGQFGHYKKFTKLKIKYY